MVGDVHGRVPIQYGLRTTLHKVAKNGRKKVVSLLLERRADRTIRDTLGKTTVGLAEAEEHEDVVTLLRTQGTEAVI